MLSKLLASEPESSQFDCPTCGATGQTGPECRRCRSDLRLLERIEHTRAAELKELVAALADHRWADALASAELVHHLRRDAASFRLVAVCQLLNRQLTAAWETHRQARGV